VQRVAPRLLGAFLVSDLGGERVIVRITEVEAYAGTGQDPGSHAHRGRTVRNAVMFGRAGLAYVYFTYGMHWCLNVVTGPAGVAAAVLVRAGEVIEGPSVARLRRARSRPGREPPDRDLARGPARLARALGADGAANGLDLLDPASGLRLAPGLDGRGGVASGPRVGVRDDRRWRYWLPGEPTVSAYRPHVARRRAGRLGGDDLPDPGSEPA
jgi:DNA-3-methyladenine glycosylase